MAWRVSDFDISLIVNESAVDENVYRSARPTDSNKNIMSAMLGMLFQTAESESSESEPTSCIRTSQLSIMRTGRVESQTVVFRTHVGHVRIEN